MALVLKDRVQQRASANGTASFSLIGTEERFQGFDNIGNNNTTYYAAEDGDGNWETGLGTYETDGSLLVRTEVFESSSANEPTAFNGTVNVWCDLPASRLQQIIGDIVAVFTQLATSVGSSLIGFIQAGVGAVDRTVEIKLRELPSIADYGASPSNTAAQNKTAIQAALDAHDTVLVPIGEFTTDPFVPNSNNRLLGVNKKKSILKLSAFVGAQHFIQNANISATSERVDSNIIIENLTIDGALKINPKWLQNPVTLTDITDPEADYVMGTGALASGIADVDLTAVLTSDAVTSVTVNDGGSGWNGHATYPYLPSTVQLLFTGGDGTGAAGYATISGGTLTSVTMTSGGKDYTSPPTVTTMGGYADIELLTTTPIARRNSGYSSTSSIVRFSKTEDCEVKNCIIKNFNAGALYDVGCLNTKFHDNTFIDVGKNDGPFPAIWAQSFGSPTAPTAAYQDTENVSIKGNKGFNLGRCFAIFAPTKGGVLENNYVDVWGESCVFVPDVIGMNGGASKIRFNHFKNGVLADIAGMGIEAANGLNVDIQDNTIEASSAQGLGVVGMTNSNIFNNELINCFTSTVNPYGPFSERFAFNAGKRPICGVQRLIEDGDYVTVGSTSDNGLDNVVFRHNKFIENRLVFPNYLFKQTKGSVNNLSDRTSIEDNTLDIPNAMELIDTSVADVWKTTIPLTIKRNLNHASDAPVVVTGQITSGSTGLKTINVGFRPSSIHIKAANNNFALGSQWDGFMSWRADGVRNDAGVYDTKTYSVGAQATSLTTSEFIRLVNASNTVQVSCEFSSWNETGFIFNALTVGVTFNYMFICYP